MSTAKTIRPFHLRKPWNVLIGLTVASLLVSAPISLAFPRLGLWTLLTLPAFLTIFWLAKRSLRLFRGYEIKFADRGECVRYTDADVDLTLSAARISGKWFVMLPDGARGHSLPSEEEWRRASSRIVQFLSKANGRLVSGPLLTVSFTSTFNRLEG
jgi:hypothetical protein